MLPRLKLGIEILFVKLSRGLINGADVEPYYPVLTSESNELYMKYVECANNYSNLYFCGRLANFNYYNHG